MIGEALYAMLMSLTAITALTQDRISPVVFREEENVLALNYNTRDVKKLECRGGTATKTGLLEIGLLAPDEVLLETLADTVTDTLDGYQGIHAGYVLSLDAVSDEFDERVEDLSAFYKALQFSFSATKLSQ